MTEFSRTRSIMTNTARPGGVGRLGQHEVARIGYGAMQLDPESSPTEEAVAVLRRAVELGVDHVDTASFYSGGEVNRRIQQALAPYGDDLVLVSKVGARHVTGEAIPLAAAQKPAELRAAVEADLAQLGVDQIHVVNLRRLDLGPGLQAEGDQIVDLDDQLAEMIALREEGKIGAIGISAVPLEIVQRAARAGIVCVQNGYSLLNRGQEDTLDFCAANDIAWVPYFPLGSSFPGFPKVADNPVVQRIADDLGATPAQVGLAWLLAHAANVLLIAGTRSIPHLEENLRVGDITLSDKMIADLDEIPTDASAHSYGVESFLDERR
jgi:pyridoxine 4-dehydrogenase